MIKREDLRKAKSSSNHTNLPYIFLLAISLIFQLLIVFDLIQFNFAWLLVYFVSTLLLVLSFDQLRNNRKNKK